MVWAFLVCRCRVFGDTLKTQQVKYHTFFLWYGYKKNNIMGIFDLFGKKKKQQYEYNPLNIQDDPNLRKFHQIPDISSAIRKELSNLYMQALVDEPNITIYTITENYTISLLTSYYENAKIVPMCIVDEIVKLVYNASHAVLGKQIYKSVEQLEQRVLAAVYKSGNLSTTSSPILTFAKQALANAQGNNERAEIEALVHLYNEVQKASSQLLTITDYNLVGSAFCLMGSYSIFMNNEDTRRVIADNAFYCLSKVIEQNPSKENHLKRLAVLVNFHKDLYYTIANAMDISDDDDFLFPMTPLIIKTNQYYYDIAYYDFQKVGLASYPEPIEELYNLVSQHVANCSTQRGKEYIDEIVDYLTSVYQQN